MFLILILFPLLTYSQIFMTPEELIKESDEKKLHLTRQWERLLHLEHGIFGKKSEADTDNFFSSKESVDDSQKELHTFIRLIHHNHASEEDDHVICRFPARAKWLKKQLKLPDELFNFSRCLKYNHFIKNNHKENQVISLVFSSYYLESPASAFGHTFLRIKQKGKMTNLGGPSELLDTGISYAANITTNNAFLYAVLGMAGGFYGEFSLLPYYYKIREYNDFESRDLWSYDLNLNGEQIHFLLDHLWELGQTKFRYFYFTENCSYELLRLLEAVDPRLHLVDKIPFYVIPVDTIKAVHEAKLVTNVEFRPSAKRKLDHYLTQLNTKEKNVLFNLIKERSINEENLKTISEKSQVKVLDTLMQYQDFKYSKEILNQKGVHFEWKKEVLNLRSEQKEKGVDEVIPLPKSESPHAGHGSTRAGLFLGENQRERGYSEFQFRFAMHDVLDPRTGHPPFANLEFFNIKLRSNEAFKRVTIKDWTFIDVMTLNPWNEYQKPTSLKANIGLKRKNIPDCYDCLALNALIGGGITKNFGNTTLYLMGETDTSYSGEYKKNHAELALGPSFNVLQSWDESFLGLLQIKYYHYLFSDRDMVTYQFEQRYHFQNNASLSYHIDLWGKFFQHQIGFYFYF